MGKAEVNITEWKDVNIKQTQFGKNNIREN